MNVEFDLVEARCGVKVEVVEVESLTGSVVVQRTIQSRADVVLLNRCSVTVNAIDPLGRRRGEDGDKEEGAAALSSSLRSIEFG